MAFLQDYAKAKHSASLIFQLIEKPTEIDSQSNDGDKPVFCIIIIFFNTTKYIHTYIYNYAICLFINNLFLGNNRQNSF